MLRSHRIQRGPPFGGQTIRSSLAAGYRPSSIQCEDISLPARAASERRRRADDPENGTIGKCPSLECTLGNNAARASECHPQLIVPCKNGDSKRIPRLHDAESLPARLSEDRKGCTNEFFG